jgi:hypothetical protein
MRQQAINFIKAANGEKTPLATAEDGIKDLRVAARYVELVSESSRPSNAAS